MEQLKQTFLKSTLVVALFASSSVFAAGVTSGQLVIINGLGNADSSSGYPGSTASSISVVVSDSTGPCSTTATVAYYGTVTVKWSASNTHSSTSCTGITSVAVTPLKTSIGTVSTVVYDSVTTTTVPATTATAVSFTPPTTAYANIALLVTGAGTPASAVTASATAWGVGAAAAPVFDTANGALTTVGIPGATGLYGIRAEEIMRHFAIMPFLG
ncbi:MULTISPECIES: hypothetical protein [Legionella]|uniref:Protein with a bacterial immunoglobulin-like domain protein n=1 Tax=Legionella steelei TaxID=947033 RepID=A0A0W0ZDZ8_9GAMM|nr:MULTISPECIES: hypothetical protein [Legionella]KTD67409.1 hypothetical protein Lste_3615 [Legionella steelei]MBN9227508.1 hypothetical protein [Legionella steelei]OJW16075.1 MAG: hypothetical protein BGO44_06205 [Legionella sp. 39-23]